MNPRLKTDIDKLRMLRTIGPLRFKYKTSSNNKFITLLFDLYDKNHTSAK